MKRTEGFRKYHINYRKRHFFVLLR